MDGNLDCLEKAFCNLNAAESQEEKSGYEGLYKNWGKSGSQEERRIELLESQKVNRNNKIDRFRGILELVNAVEDNTKIFTSNKKVPYKPCIYVAGFHKNPLSYSNVLMLSEWLIEKPNDFEQNWYMVPCPKGMRLLVIANNGTTKFYTKYGHFKFERATNLPGGNPFNLYRRNCCVLDCFYYEQSNTLFILDLLAWNNQPMTDGETEFRRYWLMTQLEDFPDLVTISKRNKVVIKVLPMTPCTTESISCLMNKFPMFDNFTPPLDGLLFYHKKAHYVAGETPLVGWLYPYMLPEVLGEEVSIHPGYLAEKPADYVNQADFIQKFAVKIAKKVKREVCNSKELGANNDDYVVLEGMITENSTRASSMERIDTIESIDDNTIERINDNTIERIDEIIEYTVIELDNRKQGRKRDKVMESKFKSMRENENKDKSGAFIGQSVSMQAEGEITAPRAFRFSLK